MSDVLNNKNEIRAAADEDVDAQYKNMRTRFAGQAQAEGYRSNSFFGREQRLVLSTINKDNGPFLDMACGSGMMLEPMAAEGHQVFGVDFNADACVGALQNGITIIRGDAYNLPLADSSIGQIVNCQFLNQQPPEKEEAFIAEVTRVLKPGGQAILLWRHAHSLIHQSAHAVFTVMDRFTGAQPGFPQYAHPMGNMRSLAERAGLSVVRDEVTLPFFRRATICSGGLTAKTIGASLFLVVRKS